MILLTGGAGYIGSHLCIALLDAGLDVVAVENGYKPPADSRSSFGMPTSAMKRQSTRYFACGVTAAIHLAGLKAFGHSNVQPMTYYENNVLRLVSVMKRASVKALIFSSLLPFTVYRRTCRSTRSILSDRRIRTAAQNRRFFTANSLSVRRGLAIGILRYFNPVGGHESGLLREDPLGVLNNLVFVAHVAIGKREKTCRSRRSRRF